MLLGSVKFKGSVAESVQKSIRPLTLITESYKYALHVNQTTVVLDGKKPYIIPIDENNPFDVLQYTENLKRELQGIVGNEAALSLDVVMRFPPRDPGGLEFDVETNLRKELHHTANNYKHYCSIVSALMAHMGYKLDNIVVPSV